MTIDEFLTNVRRIQAADPRYRLGRDGSDGYCDCIGLVIGAIRRSGGQWRGIHGTNWTARNAMHDLHALRGAGQLLRGRRGNAGGASAFERISKQGSPLFMPTALCFDAILLECVSKMRPVQFRADFLAIQG